MKQVQGFLLAEGDQPVKWVGNVGVGYGEVGAVPRKKHRCLKMAVSTSSCESLNEICGLVSTPFRQDGEYLQGGYADTAKIQGVIFPRTLGFQFALLALLYWDGLGRGKRPSAVLIWFGGFECRLKLAVHCSSHFVCGCRFELTQRLAAVCGKAIPNLVHDGQLEVRLGFPLRVCFELYSALNVTCRFTLNSPWRLCAEDCLCQTLATNCMHQRLATHLEHILWSVAICRPWFRCQDDGFASFKYRCLDQLTGRIGRGVDGNDANPRMVLR